MALTANCDFILANSIPVPFAGCWFWLGSLTDQGYGQYGHGGRHKAHRLAYVAFKGPIPAGLLIQHSCDTACCVNPEHLSAGTDASNHRDKQLKGRAAKALTLELVREIRSSGEGVRAIARRMGVSHVAVLRVRNRQTWSHV